MGNCNTGMQDAMRRLVKKAYLAKVKNDGRPFVVAHFVTNRCMCDCKSCLWKHNDWKDVPLSDLKRFYDEAKAEGFQAAAFTGGEPFLRKDLGELTRHLKEELGFSLLVFTTGWFLGERMDEVLPNIDMLMMSLDSARPERHDEIRGLPGLFDRLMQNVQLVRRKYPALSMQFNTCVQKGVEDEIDDLIALAQRMDVHISFDVITEFRQGSEDSHFTETDMALPRDTLAAVCRQLMARKAAGAPILNSARYFDYFARGRPGYRCHFPKLAMSVDGRGYVEDCLDLDHPIANIRRMPLEEIMSLPRFKQLRADAERCSSCSSPTMVDMSAIWEDPQLAFDRGGLAIQ